MSYLEIVKILLTLLPAIIEAVKAIEAAVPGGQQGPAKLAAVLSVLEGAQKVSAAAQPLLVDLTPAITHVIEALVKKFNLSKTFKRSAPPVKT